MTAPALKISHAKDAQFDRGLRSFFEYRDLGVWAAEGASAAKRPQRSIFRRFLDPYPDMGTAKSSKTILAGATFRFRRLLPPRLLGIKEAAQSALAAHVIRAIQARAAATSTSCSCSWWRCSGAGSSLTMKAAAWSGLKPAPAFISHRAPATAKSGTATTWKCSKSSCPQISGRKPPDHDPPKRLTPTHVVLGHISPCQATQQRGAATWLTLHSLPASRPRIRCS